MKVEKGGGGSILPAERGLDRLAGLKEGGAALEGSYQIVSVEDRARMVEVLSKEGQVLLVLVEEARPAVEELVEVCMVRRRPGRPSRPTEECADC